jgi:hypothetical protein
MPHGDTVELLYLSPHTTSFPDSSAVAQIHIFPPAVAAAIFFSILSKFLLILIFIIYYRKSVFRWIRRESGCPMVALERENAGKVSFEDKRHGFPWAASGPRNDRKLS